MRTHDIHPEHELALTRQRQQQELFVLECGFLFGAGFLFLFSLWLGLRMMVGGL
jgi:apolipoprotein N-acyltransferase